MRVITPLNPVGCTHVIIVCTTHMGTVWSHTRPRYMFYLFTGRYVWDTIHKYVMYVVQYNHSIAIHKQNKHIIIQTQPKLKTDSMSTNFS